MNINLYENLQKIIEESGKSYHGSGPASDEMISLYEKELSISFPESYKIFLKKYGTLSFYGISRLGMVATSAPDVRFVTQEARKLGDIDENMIQIKSSGYGPIFSIDKSIIGSNGEAAIVETELSFKRDKYKKVVANNFSEFLLNEIKNSLK